MNHFNPQFKKLLPVVLFTLLSFAGYSQNMPVCSAGSFYAITDAGTIYSYMLLANTVVYNGLVTNSPAFNRETSLAIADLGAGSSFYSSNDEGNIYQYTGGAWQSAYSGSDPYYNSGGNGKYLYYQTGDRIVRFDGSTVKTIWDGTDMEDGLITLAALAVDNNGYVYFFTGADRFSSSNTLNIIAPDGTTVGAVPITINPYYAYGCFFMGNILYVGFGEDNPDYPNQLLPITINGLTATIGTPINMPNTLDGNVVEYLDLASCVSSNVILPVTFTSIIAQSKNTNIAVSWNVENELNIAKYIVQRSANGINFTDVAVIPAKGNTSSPLNYSWLDTKPSPGNNFYRVKSYETTNGQRYSAIVKVSAGDSRQDISIYPNPVSNKTIALHLSNIKQDVYTIRIIDKIGQTVQVNTITNSGGEEAISIALPNKIPADTYILQMTSASAMLGSLKFTVQ
jgi:hypothetical protein